jgi:predicted O-linked N-acetylglucosamine transferase (SPINDLY family)
MNSPQNSPLHQAIAHFRSGNLDHAERLLKKVIQDSPRNFDAHHIIGVIYVHQNRRREAREAFEQAVEINPNNSFARFNLATVLSDSGSDAEALPHYEMAVKLAPGDQDSWVNYGRSLSNLSRLDEALDCYEQAIRINPENAQALCNRGTLLAELGRNEEALSCFENALAIDSSHPAVWLNRGNALKNLKRYEEALADYDRALQLDPDHADTWSNKGNVLGNLKQYDEALAHYDRAIQLEPRNADVWFNKGYTLSNLKQNEEALTHYDRAIQLEPGNAGTWSSKGNALVNLNRYDEALVCYDRAIQLKPEQDFLYGDWLSTKMSICDWENFEAHRDALINRINQRQNAATPFTVLGVCDDPAVQKIVAEKYAGHFPVSHALGVMSRRPAGDKIRIGYFSNEFHNHATAFLTAELFELHDRSRFEVIAFSFGAERNDAMRQRLSSSFDKFIDVRNQSDREIAQLAREMEIDIAVDLQGYQTEHRTGIFAHRAAPVQVNYLAYPGTMGAEFMDYLVADSTLIPPESQQHYSEKIVYLPDAYQPNDRKRPISQRNFTREELGLPPTGLVFCCFNSLYKITPASFDGWMRIMREVEGSVLWLFEGNQAAMQNLRQEAEKRGISAGRLVFARQMDLPEHLARHRVADLFLDTLPYNAHTTASDALWAGLPVLTIPGKSFASRVAASLLNAIHLPELITSSQEAFEQKAIELATDPKKREVLKRKLAENRLTTPLFDTPLYTKRLEAAYTEMHSRYLEEAPPVNIFVQ